MSYWTDLPLPTERELVVGLYDLRGYTAYCDGAEALRALDVIAGYHAFVGGIIAAAGGLLIKAIGDAGLFAFPAEHADPAVATTFRVQSEGDAWLVRQGYPGGARMVMHIGPAAIGRVGGPGREQLDIIGKTVNVVGAMRMEGSFAMTPVTFQRLSPPLQRRFVKSTSLAYIAVADGQPGR